MCIFFSQKFSLSTQYFTAKLGVSLSTTTQQYENDQRKVVFFVKTQVCLML